MPALRRLAITGFAIYMLQLACLVTVSAQEDEPDCSAPETQADMTTCAGIDADAADKDLNRQYKATRKVLAERDNDAGDDESAVDALVAAQRAWVSFRDANCNVFGFQAHGGSMEPTLVSACLADMSRKRSDDLRQLSEGF